MEFITPHSKGADCATVKKRFTLTAKALLMLVAFLTVITVFSGIGVICGSFQESKEYYSRLAYSYTRTAADYIDGDVIYHYFETREKDDYYNDILNLLRAAQKDAALKYYYVFIPFENDIVYIWDSDANEEPYELGYREKYTDNDKEYIEQALKNDLPDEIYFSNNKKYGFIVTSYAPVFDSSGKTVAIVGADVAIEGLINTIWDYVAVTVISILTVCLISMGALYVIMRRRVIKPIEIINNTAKRMVNCLESNVVPSIELQTGDELEELAESFNQMSCELQEFLARLTAMTAERERFGAELSLATKIQRNMLPSTFPPFPGRPEFDIYASMDPAKEVGGDFYDFFLIDDNHLAMVIADVSGKGVPAALFMMASKILIYDNTLMGGTPAEILDRVNMLVYSNNTNHMFLTVWLGILEISTGMLTTANAGHEYPFLKTNGRFEKLKDKHGTPIGAFKIAKYSNYEIPLKKGNCIFVYTDGVAEAYNKEKQFFGVSRTLDVLNAAPDASPREMIKNVRSAVNRYVNGTLQSDDITMLCISYFGTEKDNEGT